MGEEVEIIDEPSEEHWIQWKNLIIMQGWCGFDYTMLSLFPKGENVKMVVAVLKNDKSFIGSIVWAENEDLICIDTYYVIEQYRGRGVGPRMWRRMMERLDGTRPLMLKAEHGMMPKYVANGFPIVSVSQNCVEPRKSELLATCKLLETRASSINGYNEEKLRFIRFDELNSQQFDALCRFDKKVTGKDRGKLLKSIQELSLARGGVMIDEMDMVCSFAIISKALPEGSYKLAPLYAESDLAAAKVVQGILEDLNTGDSMIQVHIPQRSRGERNLAPIFEELKVFIEFDSTTLLSTNYENPVNLDLLYVNHDHFMHFDL